nr:hypothetical protein L203_00413 [Cryptococcus depauperatus CBS 7841]
MICTLHETRAKKMPICQVCDRPLFFRSLPKRVQCYDDAYVSCIIRNTPVESRSPNPAGLLVLLRMVIERYRKTIGGSSNFDQDQFNNWMMDLHYGFTKRPLDWSRLDRITLTIVWQCSFGPQGPTLSPHLIDTRLHFDDVWDDPGRRHAAVLEGLLALNLHPDGKKALDRLNNLRRLLRAKDPCDSQRVWNISERLHRIAVTYVTKARQLWIYCRTQTYAEISATRHSSLGSLVIPPTATIDDLLRLLEGVQPNLEDFDWEYLHEYPTKSPVWPHSDFRVAAGLGLPVPAKFTTMSTSEKDVAFPKPSSSQPNSNLTAPASNVTTTGSINPPPPVPTRTQLTPRMLETPQKSQITQNMPRGTPIIDSSHRQLFLSESHQDSSATDGTQHRTSKVDDAFTATPQSLKTNEPASNTFSHLASSRSLEQSNGTFLDHPLTEQNDTFGLANLSETEWALYETKSVSQKDLTSNEEEHLDQEGMSLVSMLKADEA